MQYRLNRLHSSAICIFLFIGCLAGCLVFTGAAQTPANTGVDSIRAEDLRQLMRHPAHMAGSDGIFTGGFPHPRGCGCFARYLGHHVREDKTWSLEQAVQHLAAHAARRFALKDRGMLREGMAADICVFDPQQIADRSTYDDGRQLAAGMSHVIVNGQLVLHEGNRTSALPGRALRR